MTRGFRRPRSRARGVAAPPRIPSPIRVVAAPCSPRLRGSSDAALHSDRGSEARDQERGLTRTRAPARSARLTGPSSFVGS
jgi:hypothetical protein